MCMENGREPPLIIIVLSNVIDQNNDFMQLPPKSFHNDFNLNFDFFLPTLNHFCVPIQINKIVNKQ